MCLIPISSIFAGLILGLFFSAGSHSTCLLILFCFVLLCFCFAVSSYYCRYWALSCGDFYERAFVWSCQVPRALLTKDHFTLNTCMLNIETTQEVWIQSVKLKSDGLWLWSLKESFSFPPYSIKFKRDYFSCPFLRGECMGCGEMIPHEHPILYRPEAFLGSTLPDSLWKQTFPHRKFFQGELIFELYFPLDALASNSLLSCLFIDAFIKKLFLIFPPVF